MYIFKEKDEYLCIYNPFIKMNILVSLNPVMWHHMMVNVRNKRAF